MRHIVQTARETIDKDVNGNARSILVDKVTIGCATAKEAQAIVETLQFIPSRRVFAGIELYTEGGVKIVLSYSDVNEIAREANDLLSSQSFSSNL